MVLFWGTVIFGIVALVLCASRSRQRGSEHHEAAPSSRLPAERFARGDIDEEEYRRSWLTASHRAFPRHVPAGRPGHALGWAHADGNGQSSGAWLQVGPPDCGVLPLAGDPALCQGLAS
jgi:putative membrane protein